MVYVVIKHFRVSYPPFCTALEIPTVSTYTFELQYQTYCKGLASKCLLSSYVRI